MTDQLPADDRSENSVTVRYWASARAAAGIDAEQVEGDTLADVLAEISRRHGRRDRFDDVISTCSVLIDEVPSTRDPHEVSLHGRRQVDLLPPFAGGAV